MLKRLEQYFENGIIKKKYWSAMYPLRKWATPESYIELMFDIEDFYNMHPTLDYNTTSLLIGEVLDREYDGGLAEGFTEPNFYN